MLCGALILSQQSGLLGQALPLGASGTGLHEALPHILPFILHSSPPQLLIVEHVYTRLCGKAFRTSHLILSTTSLERGRYFRFSQTKKCGPDWLVDCTVT